MLLRAPNGALIDASAAHAPLLLAAGWTPVEQPQETAAEDLTSLTVAELRTLCAERGIDAPKRATKARLVGLLDGQEAT